MSTLVLTAHGSKDPRSAANTHAVADRLRAMRPGLKVHVAFLELTAPRLADVLAELPAGHHAVITPLLLADAYHARIDIPGQLHACAARGTALRQADVLGEDDRLVRVLRERLAQLGVSRLDSGLGVVVLAVGSSHAPANARTATVATKLAARTRWAGATTAFATGPGPTPAQAVTQLRRHGARHVVIAPWFLAPGLLTDRISAYAHNNGIPMAHPLGAHPLVAQTVLDRYEPALAKPVAA